MDSYNISLNSSITSDSSFNISQYPLIWIIGFVVNIALIIIAIWLFSSASVFGNICGCFPDEKLQSERKRLLQMAAVASALTLPRLILTQFLFWIGYSDNKKDQFCEIVLDMSIVVYVVAYVVVYLFLWLRQQFILKQPSVILKNIKKIKVLRWICFWYIIVAAVAMIFVYVEPLAHRSTQVGCYDRGNETKTRLNLPFNVYYLSAATMVMAQLCLMALLVYPLVRLWDKNQRHQKSTTFNASKQRILEIIKQIVTCAFGCIISDLTASVLVGAVINNREPRYLSNTILDISMILNIVFFFRSFESYKNIFSVPSFNAS